MKPSKSPTQGYNSTQEKLQLKVALGHFFPQRVFFRGSGLLYVGNGPQETKPNQIFRKHPIDNTITGVRSNQDQMGLVKIV